MLTPNSIYNEHNLWHFIAALFVVYCKHITAVTESLPFIPWGKYPLLWEVRLAEENSDIPAFGNISLPSHTQLHYGYVVSRSPKYSRDRN